MANDHDRDENLVAASPRITRTPAAGAKVSAASLGGDMVIRYLDGGPDVDACRRGETTARCEG